MKNTFKKRPKWKDLTPTQQLLFKYNLGPSWFPIWVSNFIEYPASFFFNEASWQHHDFGYFTGKSILEKFEYDFKFLRAMLHDSFKQPLPKLFLAVVLSFLFYVSVTLFGWFSFNFGPTYALLSETDKNINSFK